MRRLDNVGADRFVVAPRVRTSLHQKIDISTIFGPTWIKMIAATASTVDRTRDLAHLCIQSANHTSRPSRHRYYCILIEKNWYL